MADAPLRRGDWLDPATGARLDHRAAIARLAGCRVVCLGETHDRADIHRWQLHVSAGLLAMHGNVTLGFEMFPRRVQPALDCWVAGDLDEDAFLVQSEWIDVWRFDPTLYLPLFRFCRECAVPMLALNCERLLVTRVGKEGWDAIPEDERDGLTPARPATAAYRRHLFDLIGDARPGRGSSGPDDPAFDHFVRAQQTWHRAFACNMLPALGRPDPPLVVGIIGRGHLEYGHGTPFQLANLSVEDVAVALPLDEGKPAPPAGIADLVFRL